MTTPISNRPTAPAYSPTERLREEEERPAEVRVNPPPREIVSERGMGIGLHGGGFMHHHHHSSYIAPRRRDDGGCC